MMSFRSLTILYVVAALSAVAVRPALAQEAAEEKITYDDHVRPVLREHCFSCHNPDRAKSDLAVDSYGALMRGGASGEVVIAGDLSSSRLWGLVSHTETPEMPPEQDKLADAKLEIIRKWILGGALENSGSTAKPSSKPKFDLSVTSGSARPEGPPPMPEGLLKQPPVYTPRAAAATAVAASPWAPLVALGGQKQVVLYHADTGELLGILPFPEGVPHVLKFSRSGSLLLCGGGRAGQHGLVVVYDVRTGERVFEVGDELDAVLAADINENHTLIALGGPSRVVRIYSTADGSLVQEIRKHTEWIYAIEFSPDGVLLATADRNGGMFVWEPDTGREYQNLKGHTGAITDISWRIDSNILASASEDTTIRLWEMNNGSQIKSWGAHGGGAWSVKFAHDGRLVSTGRDRVTKLWDQEGNQALAFEATPDIGLEVAITHDGGRVLSGDWSGDYRMWNTADGALALQLAANPPTLEMSLESATQSATTAAAELAALQQAAAEKAAAVQAATEKFTASQAEADKAEVDRLTAEQAEADRLVAEKNGQVASLNEKIASITADLDKVAAAAAASAQASAAQ
jgi:WD40 repeat protein